MNSSPTSKSKIECKAKKSSAADFPLDRSRRPECEESKTEKFFC